MQLSTDAALAAAVDSPVRAVVSELKVDWARDGLYQHALSDLSAVCDDITLRRDIVGSLPEQATLVEGFIGAQLTLSLSGTRPADTASIAQLLSPVKFDSPLFGSGRTGAPVRWRLGLQTAAGTVPMMDQFTGYISSFYVSGTGTVNLVCTDTDRLHTKINLPTFGLSRPGTLINPGGRLRINSQWVIDYILRRNGIYQSPPMMPGCIYSATGHGSMIPERGFNFLLGVLDGACTENDDCSVPGRWGLAYNGNEFFQTQWSARANGQFRPVQNKSWSIQFQVDGTKIPVQRTANGGTFVAVSSGRGLFAAGTTTWAVRIDRAGRIWSDFYGGATLIQSVGGPNVNLAGWSNVFVLVDFLGATLNNCAVSFPNQTSSGVNLTGLPTNPTIWDGATVLTANPAPVQNVQICDATGLAGASLYDPLTFVPQCDLDPGLNEFYSMPVRRGKDSLELLREVVAAEYGVAGFTESGRFFFKNRNSATLGNLITEKTIKADSSLVELGVWEKIGATRNVITAQVKSMTLPDHYQTVWDTSSINELIVPKGISTFSLVLDRPCSVEDFINMLERTTVQWDAPSDADLTHKFIAVDGAFTELSGVIVDVIPDPTSWESGVDRVTLRINCPFDLGVRFSTTDGRPAFRIGGQFVEDDSPELIEVRRQSSIDRYGEQVYELPQSDWLQLAKPIRSIALGLLRDLSFPAPLLDQIQVIGDPRLQLLDTCEVSDLRTTGIGGPLLTTTQVIQRTWSQGAGLNDTLSVRLFTYPGRWILGHPQYSILGSTTILG